jgi:hypothetical protein
MAARSAGLEWPSLWNGQLSRIFIELSSTESPGDGISLMLASWHQPSADQLGDPLTAEPATVAPSRVVEPLKQVKI